MEFAEWVVSGLDQLRLGQLPAGNDFYTVASAGLGGDTRLAAYMNSGDPAARAELVQLIADAVTANPGFEQQLRYAAASAQTGGAGAAKPSFFKTTNGLLVIVAAVVVVVGGGIGLGLGLSGGSGDLAGMLKGTWTCQASGFGADGPVSLTIGDGTWTGGNENGTWKQNGSTATLHDNNSPTNDIKVTGLPSGSGSFDIALGSSRDPSASVHIKGNVSAHKLTLAVPAGLGGAAFTVTCTK